MDEREQAEHLELCLVIRSCVSALRLSRLAATDDDVAVAVARLENWLAENDGRWVTE